MLRKAKNVTDHYSNMIFSFDSFVVGYLWLLIIPTTIEDKSSEPLEEVIIFKIKHTCAWLISL